MERSLVLAELIIRLAAKPARANRAVVAPARQRCRRCSDPSFSQAMTPILRLGTDPTIRALEELGKSLL
jgi:hypothetical protein